MFHICSHTGSDVKHDAWLRDEARHWYELNIITADADFERAERERDDQYLEAVDVAFAKRARRWEWEAQMRQLLLL